MKGSEGMLRGRRDEIVTGASSGGAETRRGRNHKDTKITKPMGKDRSAAHCRSTRAPASGPFLRAERPLRVLCVFVVPSLSRFLLGKVDNSPTAEIYSESSIFVNLFK